jgi:hypothetical protein
LTGRNFLIDQMKVLIEVGWYRVEKPGAGMIRKELQPLANESFG